MNSLLASEKCLPPGLWLPTADEPTAQYLTTNFANKERSYEELVEYGKFIVALTVLGQDTSCRVSLMPNENDIKDMHDAGYGIPEHTLFRKHGGITKLQRALGFFPKNYFPGKGETLERFQWISKHAYQMDPLPQGGNDIQDIIAWGSARHLSPGPKMVYRIFEGDTTELRKLFDLEKHDYRRQYTKLDLYRFGAKVLHENGKPISRDELNNSYPDEFVSSPKAVIGLRLGSLTEFWAEFGYLPQSLAQLSDQDVLNFGVRKAIRDEGYSINYPMMQKLSKDRVFPSKSLIHSRFGGNRAYADLVMLDYGRYLALKDTYHAKGVSPNVFKVACRLFTATAEFEARLDTSSPALAKLSIDSPASRYVLLIMQKGFDLLDKQTMALQFDDFTMFLHQLGITSLAEVHQIFDIVPRFDADEAILILRDPKRELLHAK